MLRKLGSSARALEQEWRIRRELSSYRRAAARRGIPEELDSTPLRERLASRLRSRGLVPKRKDELRFVYASPMSEWERVGPVPSLEALGTVELFSLDDRGFDDRAPDWPDRRKLLDDALVRFVGEAHSRRPVDLLVSYLSGWHISAETIRAINRMGICTAAFWWDDRLSFRGSRRGGRFSGAASLASAYDLNLTNAPDSIVKYLVEGGLAMFWPEAANPSHHRPLGGELELDVSFVGACYGPRLGFVEGLRRNGIQVMGFGPGWPGGALSSERMVEVYARSRINLGFGGIGQSAKEMCLKGRDFEVPMCGALYLTSDHEALGRVFHRGEEIVTYRDIRDCQGAIRHLLSDPEACARIRIAGRERCLRDHTWERRFRQLLATFGLLD